jgi:hypothetical protein
MKDLAKSCRKEDNSQKSCTKAPRIRAKEWEFWKKFSFFDGGGKKGKTWEKLGDCRKTKDFRNKIMTITNQKIPRKKTIT